MCDLKTQLSTDASSSCDGGPTAACDPTSDTISMTSDVSADQLDHHIMLQHEQQMQQQQHQQLHQTTQSLLMASTMLVGSSISNVGDSNVSTNFNTDNDIIKNHSHGHYSSANIFGSTDSMNGPLMSHPLNVVHTMPSSRSTIGQLIINSPSNLKTMQINVNELIMENHVLREKLKEVTTDRDRLMCEYSNLRLEIDMLELKRLPEEK